MNMSGVRQCLAAVQLNTTVRIYYKQSARFVISCLQSKMSLVWFVARFRVFVNHCSVCHHCVEMHCTVVLTLDGILICLLLVILVWVTMFI